MAKRDPEKTRRNKEIERMSERLKEILPEVLAITSYVNELSLNAKLGGKHGEFMDIKNEVILSADQFVVLWMKGLIGYLESLGDYKRNSRVYELHQFIKEHQVVREYAVVFLERTYLRNFEALSKVRPRVEDSVIWIGQENATYGLLVTPTFRNDNWENDKSEIRHFKRDYWTIGHILETGLVVPFEEEIIKFYDVEQYLVFYKNTLVRASGSKYEKEIANRYCDYVRESKEPEKVPLLIPEYGDLDKKHKYRLDFTIIDPHTMNKFGFELSPWSTHGQITGTKNMTQAKINEQAKANFEKEMKKHKDYFRKFGIFVLIYTDSDLEDLDNVFNDMEKYLNLKKVPVQLKMHVWDEFLNYE